MARTKSHRWRIPLIIAGGALGTLAAVTAVWVVYLDRVVTREFQGRHWSVPARVFAAPLDLYVGAPVGADDLEEELRRLHYRSGDPAAGPGLLPSARRVLRSAFAPRALRRRAARARAGVDPRGQRLDHDLRHADGTDLPVFRLDPLLIGSVFPVHGEDRIVLSPADVPPLLRSAIKLIEDRRFDEHHGVDPYGILRALWANLRAGRVVQGGSTLTQQLVKNYFLSDEQTIGRKATEAVMALRLEAHFSKEEILVAYLNEVYLGQDGERAIHGFGLGSEYYFAKPLDELDVGELALLIGLVKGPSYYDPQQAPRPRARAAQSRAARTRGRASDRRRGGETRRRRGHSACGRRAAAMCRPISISCAGI